ncbi:MAG: thioredoxin domain-containing protein [Gammaproteobacteria bacterium]|nr:MAG: thioredoxin domain-containing protein [Gammaproteobacteria bacterium]
MKRLIIRLLVAAASLLGALPLAAANSLADSPSPYLAMHGQDPVDWHDMRDTQALQKARRLGRPLFISSGYFACHWCHVMQRETYSDPEVARFINEHFVAFKLDRELDPVIDARLIRFVEYTQGTAGWPLNVVLTPEGYPFYGFTYLPKARFLDVMRQLATLWQDDREEIERLARGAAEELDRLTGAAEKPLPHTPRSALKAAFLKAVRASADRFEGGFGNSIKFPSVPQLEALLNLNAEREFLATTLDVMQQRNLQDHLHGGFFRYSTDPGWHTPHFEKMLYDNAQLARLYLRAGRLLDRRDWQQTGLRTVEFARRWMRHPRDGYIASLSAVDDQGHEGGFYLWTRAEVEAALTPRERAVLVRHWDYTAPPEFEEGNLPPRIDPRTPDAAALGRIYRKLAEHARAHRKLPQDDKRLIAWNALMLSALAECAASDTDCRSDGQALARWLAHQAGRPEGLPHALDSQDRPVGTATLEDHALLIAALDDWMRAQPARRKALEPVRRRLARAARQRYLRPDGWLANDHPLLSGDRPRRHFPDTVLPSPTARIYARLASAGADGLHSLKDLACTPVAGMQDNPFEHASWISSPELDQGCGEVKR